MGHADMLITIYSNEGVEFEYLMEGKDFISEGKAINRAISKHEEYGKALDMGTSICHISLSEYNAPIKI